MKEEDALYNLITTGVSANALKAYLILAIDARHLHGGLYSQLSIRGLARLMAFPDGSSVSLSTAARAIEELKIAGLICHKKAQGRSKPRISFTRARPPEGKFLELLEKINDEQHDKIRTRINT